METLIINKIPQAIVIAFNRQDQGNTINHQLLVDLNSVLTQYESDDSIKAIILESNSNVFCAGMDFKGVFAGDKEPMEWIVQYKQTLKRFTEIGKLMIAKVEGKVLAGGMGLVAACDLVVANDRASFNLPESLWGLLPANVLPYLIRRIGFQPAYFMTATTQTMDAAAAKQIHLVDILSHEPDVEINQILKKINCVATSTLLEMKKYFKQLWILNDATEKLAVDTLDHLTKTDLFKMNAKNFIENKIFPWDKAK